MSLISITAEDTHFRYLPGGTDLLAVEGSLFPAGPVPPHLLTQLADGPQTRLAQFQSLLPPHDPITYVLTWTDGTNLSQIDAGARAGQLVDRDFYMCFRAAYSRTRCFTCQSVYHTLVIIDGDPYPGNPKLDGEKVRRAPLLTCPNCRASLRRLVVKILGEPITLGST